MSLPYTLQTFIPNDGETLLDDLQSSEAASVASAIVSSDLSAVAKIRESVLRGACDGLSSLTKQSARGAYNDLLAKHADDLRGLLVTHVASYAPDLTRSNLCRVVAAAYIDAYSTGWCLGHMEMEFPCPRRIS